MNHPKTEVDLFFEKELFWLKGIKVLAEQAIKQAQEQPCILDNSYHWEQMYGYIERHLAYLAESGYCSKELQKFFGSDE